MNITKIGIMPYQRYRFTPAENQQNNKAQAQNSVYNPVAYRDYNISFGDRLFRSPENFYEQQFNRENMPQTMKSYLFDDYSDRSHIPPAQMMRIVFNDINNAKSLEEVKDLFPSEPLFANLHNSKKKHREGILAEINLMHENDKSLFKNGKDDLGLYILKKIYIEGKTLKEINKDFHNDVSVVYAGISDINYRDISNMGIKFPNQAFWHSFYVTREDFPYVSVKKKDSEFHANGGGKKELTLADINSGNFEDKRKPKYTPKDHEIKGMKDAILEDFGDSEKTRKNLKRKLKSDDPKLTFIQQYMGEIMSVSLDRVHASDEMRSFFENYDNIDSTSRSRMKKYWDTTPEMKALQGLVMSDTIKLFFEAYGADGKNEVFTDLIDYAHSIKPAREERIRLHNEKQLYYDELGKELEELDKKPAVAEEEKPADKAISKPFEEMSSEEVEELMKQQAKLYKNKLTFVKDGEKYTLYSNLDEELTKCVDMNFKSLLPKPYSDKYAKYLCKSDLADETYKFTVISRNSNYDYSIIQSCLYDDKALEEKTDEINYRFMKKYPVESRAAHQAYVDTISHFIPEAKDDLASYVYKALPLDIPVLSKDIQPNMEGTEDFMNERYRYYLKPLNIKEGNAISSKICKEIIAGYSAENSVIFKAPQKEGIFIEAFSKFFEDGMGQEQKLMRNYLQQYIINEYGGSARAVLDDNLSQKTKISLTEQITRGFIMAYHKEFTNAIMMNQKSRRCIMKYGGLS